MSRFPKVPFAHSVRLGGAFLLAQNGEENGFFNVRF
jgi:hypothetical protein